MARILLIAAIFFLSFSENLSAAEIQMKTPAPLTQVDTQACKDAHDKCLEMKDGKDLNACVKACEEAENECNPTKNPNLKVKNKTDLTHTRYGIARGYRKTCAKGLKQ